MSASVPLQLFSLVLGTMALHDFDEKTRQLRNEVACAEAAIRYCDLEVSTQTVECGGLFDRPDDINDGEANNSVSNTEVHTLSVLNESGNYRFFLEQVFSFLFMARWRNSSTIYNFTTGAHTLLGCFVV